MHPITQHEDQGASILNLWSQSLDLFKDYTPHAARGMPREAERSEIQDLKQSSRSLSQKGIAGPVEASDGEVA